MSAKRRERSEASERDSGIQGYFEAGERRFGVRCRFAYALAAVSSSHAPFVVLVVVCCPRSGAQRTWKRRGPTARSHASSRTLTSGAASCTADTRSNPEVCVAEQRDVIEAPPDLVRALFLDFRCPSVKDSHDQLGCKRQARHGVRRPTAKSPCSGVPKKMPEGVRPPSGSTRRAQPPSYAENRARYSGDERGRQEPRRLPRRNSKPAPRSGGSLPSYSSRTAT